ncbi:uncharacterized protein LOC113549289 [Rhopalosiphum maidis]|uniref:uncharacterized protein LOC113549289 n=1 Tax=Rhopalosiphum maidis TaxID=43146 RepID=UPI000F0024D0|nr:uncharacterized protein LOC113549289 [Rhopalosiphum maidis]
MLEKHNSSNIHKLSVEKYKSWVSAKKTGSVATKLNTQLKEDILKNREIMRSLIRCVLYCGRQDIALQLHAKALAEVEKVIKSVEEISSEKSIPVTEKRKKNVSSKLTDYFVTSSIGQNQMDNISEHEIKMRNQYFEIIDTIVMEMNQRFKQTELIEACNPSFKMFLDFVTLIKFPGISTDNQFIENMGASFLQLEEVYRRILVIPISSATAERSFSTMRRIKTYNRSTMAGKRLYNLALLSIEREKSEALIQNPYEILNEFASDKLRRLNFSM